jgi:hypothetical protein
LADKHIQFHPIKDKEMNNQIMSNRQKHLISKMFDIAVFTLLTITATPVIADQFNPGNPDIVPQQSGFRCLTLQPVVRRVV